MGKKAQVLDCYSHPTQPWEISIISLNNMFLKDEQEKSCCILNDDYVDDDWSKGKALPHLKKKNWMKGRPLIIGYFITDNIICIFFSPWIVPHRYK